MTKVYLVMGNDFPAAVCATEAGAEEYCKMRRENDLVELQRQLGRPLLPDEESSPRIFWRHYEFEVKS